VPNGRNNERNVGNHTEKPIKQENFKNATEDK
jgi:hypothetical protein